MSSLRAFASQVARQSGTMSHVHPSAPPRGAAAWIHIEKKLNDLGITLPAAPKPKANYNIVCHATGNMLYISGHLPVLDDGSVITGRIGPQSDGKTIDHGYKAARQAGLNIVSTLKEQLGDLDRVKQVVKVRFLVKRLATW